MFTNKIIKRLVVFSLALLFSGCAMKPGPGVYTYSESKYISDPKSSRALNIAKAAGLMRLKDEVISVEEATERGIIGPTDINDGTYHPAFILGSTGVVVWNNFLGVASFPLAAANIITLLAARKSSSASNSFFGWTSEAKKDEILKDVSTQIIGDLGVLLSEKNDDVKVFTGDTYSVSLNGYSILNDKCEAGDKVYKTCTYGAGYYNKGAREEYSSHFDGVIESVNPDFVTSERGIFFRGGLIDSVSSNNLLHNTFEMWSKVSESLPKQTYLYLAPGKYLLVNADGLLIRGRAPLIIDHGKVEMFITVEDQ